MSEPAQPPAPTAPATATDPAQTHVVTQWEHSSPLVSCRFDPQGRFVFAGAEDMTVQRWNLGTGAKTALAGHESWVRSLAFLPDGETLLTGGYDGRLVWWPAAAETPTPIRTVPTAHAGWIRALAVSPDGKLIASCGNDNLVRIWNAADGQLVRELAGHASHVYSVLFHPSGEFVVSGDLLGQIHHWDLATGALVRKLDAGPLHTYEGGQAVHFGGVRTMAVSHDSKWLACGGLHKATNPLGAVHEPLVLSFDWSAGSLFKSQVTPEYAGVLWRVLYHPEGYLLGIAGGSGGGVLLFWKPEEEQTFVKFGLPNLARDGDLHPDGRQVATAHSDRHLRISRLEKKAGA
ncbi:MAG: WD40 repeat domain-containing protein [Planctomycetaceae bacterium]|nr:WD40 repeat domain-containing protein [Planctomycetaceae bacterium]